MNERRSIPKSAEAERDIAEYVALREEILARLNSQTTLVGICLTAVGVAFGLALSDKGVPRQVLLVVPPIVSGLGFFYAYNSRAMLLLGRYLRTELWPRLNSDPAGDGRAASWEHFLLGYRQGLRFSNWWTRLRWMSLEVVGAATVFLLPSMVALIAYTPRAAWSDAPALGAVWALDAFLVLIELVVAVQLLWDYENRQAGRRSRS